MNDNLVKLLDTTTIETMHSLIRAVGGVEGDSSQEMAFIQDQLARSDVKVVPESPRDWRAVHTLIAVLTSILIASTSKVLEMSCRRAQHYREGTANEPLTNEEAKEHFLSTVEFRAARYLLAAHVRLVENGVLGTDNADIHYARMLGVAEEMCRKDIQLGARKDDSQTRDTDRRVEEARPSDS